MGCPCDGEHCRIEAGDERHGTVNGYVNLGCRCDDCRSGWAEYYRNGSLGESVKRWRQKNIDAGLTANGHPRKRRKPRRDVRLILAALDWSDAGGNAPDAHDIAEIIAKAEATS